MRIPYYYRDENGYAVHAMRRCANNSTDLLSWLGQAHEALSSSDDALVIICSDRTGETTGFQLLNVGDWVVRRGPSIDVVSHETFAKQHDVWVRLMAV